MNSINYGFDFNNFEINNNILIKKCKNKYGYKKIKDEILFFQNVIDEKINFPIPKIYDTDISRGIIKMEYLKDCDVLTNIFYKKNKHKIITKIMKNINNLHKYKKKVKKEDYINDLNIETNYKIVSRFEQTHWTEIKEYNMIKTVNNEKIKNIKYYLDVINNKIKKIIDKKTVYEYNLIHGDIHLGNILIKKDDLYFIDPRGYFGNSKLYGIKEYDYAKLLFGISGYSIFDNMNIDRLIIKNNNIEISFIDNYIDFLNNNYFDELTKLLVLTIWLGNNSCFRNNNKKIMSLMISFYLCEKYLQNNS